MSITDVLLFLGIGVIVVAMLVAAWKQNQKDNKELVELERSIPKEGDSGQSGGAPVRLGADKVVVTDIDMPFGSMVTFMVKWAIASIPAALILGGFFLLVMTIVGGMSRY